MHRSDTNTTNVLASSLGLVVLKARVDGSIERTGTEQQWQTSGMHQHGQIPLVYHMANRQQMSGKTNSKRQMDWWAEQKNEQNRKT